MGEMPSELFARLVSETIAATTGRVVLDPKQFTFDPGQRLTGTLQRFGLDAHGWRLSRSMTRCLRAKAEA
jgi:hypothetical protein